MATQLSASTCMFAAQSLLWESAIAQVSPAGVGATGVGGGGEGGGCVSSLKHQGTPGVLDETQQHPREMQPVSLMPEKPQSTFEESATEHEPLGGGEGGEGGGLPELKHQGTPFD